MDNKRIIYSTRENIKSTLVIFLKYKKSVLWVDFFVVLLTLLTQFAATYLPGWIVDLLTGENAGTQIWTRVLPVVALIGISELVIEVLNRKKALAYQAVSQKTALDINRVQVGARYRLTEEKVFKHFKAITESKNVFFISHRLSACKICDRILVFDQQGIVQQGTHDALLENADGLYYKMWHAQTKNYMV